MHDGPAGDRGFIDCPTARANQLNKNMNINFD